MPEIDSLDTRLSYWLDQRGLLRNPFESWNADRDPDLPGYFVDIGQFDELLRQSKPCIVFAQRGCGKTAQRQMLASQCRPLKSDSSQLAVLYTYAGFEQALAAATNNPAQVEPIDHVNVLLRLGLTALEREAERDPRVQAALAQPGIAVRRVAYLVRFAPHLVADLAVGATNRLEGLSSSELLEGFGDLIKAAGLNLAVVLVDGLDEFPLTASHPSQLVALLAPLLGTLSLIECSGLAFKFFLPQEIEAALRNYRWFRPTRLDIFHIAWTPPYLRKLISQRLTYFSKKGDRAYTQIGQLCEDDLAKMIDRELVGLASGLPRAALALADLLLRLHCSQVRPPERIALAIWKAAKEDWMEMRADFLEEPLAPNEPQLSSREEPAVASLDSLPSDLPGLTLDKKKRRAWLGEREVTGVTALEFRVLASLYENQGEVCDKDTLVEQAWMDSERDVSDETIAACIARLRRKLGQSTPYRGYIETVKETGYRLHPRGFASE
jgi:hypothetical protein